MTYEQPLVFTREDDGHIDAFAVLCVHSDQPLTQPQALCLLRNAVTHWINTTPAGVDVYHYAGGVPNVADLAGYLESDGFQQSLGTQMPNCCSEGLKQVALEVVSVNEGTLSTTGDTLDYDLILPKLEHLTIAEED